MSVFADDTTEAVATMDELHDQLQAMRVAYESAKASNAEIERLMIAICRTYEGDDGEATIQIDPPTFVGATWRAALVILPNEPDLNEVTSRKDGDPPPPLPQYSVAIGHGPSFSQALQSLASLRGVT
jgi:hypothetical protein